MLDKNNLPKHIAIIMDGNGRWAKKKRLPRTAGHREGVRRTKEIIRAAAELRIQVLTLFAFSTENWKRPKKEIGILMNFLNNFLERNISELDKNNIKFKVIGRAYPLPDFIQIKIKEAEEKTKDNTGLVLVLALNYGARQEIVDAIKKFSELAIEGRIKIDDLDEDKFEHYLYTTDLPDPDLLIRTSGELRLSNFMLWQLSYAELYFTKKYWPDFRKEDFEAAIKEYQKRQRRFGSTDAYKKDN